MRLQPMQFPGHAGAWRQWADERAAGQIATALVLSGLAVAASRMLGPWTGDRHMLVPIHAAVVAATWLSGWRAGLAVAWLAQLPVSVAWAAGGLAAGVAPALASAAGELAACGTLVYLTHRARSAYGSLNRTVLRLRQADHRKSDFIALVAHELRNPLSTVSMGAGLIKRGDLEPRAVQGTWAMMERQTAHMQRLVADLLDITRIEQSKMLLDCESVSIAQAVADAVADARVFADARRQEIALRMPPDPGCIVADRGRLSQMLVNLLQNASKFSPHDSVIELTVTCEPTALVISVKDSGVGIPADELEKIFEPFVQIGAKREQSHGLGLGLALVRKLAQLHGGSVHACSEGVGCGAEFVLRLPFGGRPSRRLAPPAPERAAAAPPVRVARRAPAHAAPAPLRLLVVDDNDDAAESLALLLQMDGHEAATAHDGGAALRIAEQQRPDFVFLDVGLPDMSGLEVAVRLRKLMEHDQPVLVALSGWGGDDDRRRCAQAGFDAHLTKPVSSEQIAQALTLRSPGRT